MTAFKRGTRIERRELYELSDDFTLDQTPDGFPLIGVSATAGADAVLDQLAAGTVDLNVASIAIGGLQVLGARITGWTVPTGMQSRDGFIVYSADLADAEYSQSQLQAVMYALEAVQQTVAALVQDASTTGWIGA